MINTDKTVNKENITILGIESSCDETAAAVVRNGREVLSNVISSQIDIHTAVSYTHLPGFALSAVFFPASKVSFSETVSIVNIILFITFTVYHIIQSA